MSRIVRHVTCWLAAARRTGRRSVRSLRASLPLNEHDGSRVAVSKRRRLLWWDGNATVFRTSSPGSDKLVDTPLTFHAEDAHGANEAMKVVARVLHGHFSSSPAELIDFLTGGKANAMKTLKEKGGLSPKPRTQYVKILAAAHLLATLDVWRRNTALTVSG